MIPWGGGGGGHKGDWGPLPPPLQLVCQKRPRNSLHSVIEDGTFKGTTFGKETWKSLINGSSLQV